MKLIPITLISFNFYLYFFLSPFLACDGKLVERHRFFRLEQHDLRFSICFSLPTDTTRCCYCSRVLGRIPHYCTGRVAFVHCASLFLGTHACWVDSNAQNGPPIAWLLLRSVRCGTQDAAYPVGQEVTAKTTPDAIVQLFSMENDIYREYLHEQTARNGGDVLGSIYNNVRSTSILILYLYTQVHTDSIAIETVV